MHISKVLIAAVTAAVAVSASPAPLERRTNPYEECTGDQNSSQLCCIDNSVLIELLFGLIPINVPGLLCALSSGGCVNQQLCCVNNGDGDQTCYNDNGNSIEIPITIGAGLR